MDIESAAIWMAGIVLVTLGIIAIVVGAVIINNILHRYWKPVTIFTTESFSLFGGRASYQWVENHPEVQAERKKQQEQERIAPTLDSETKKK